VNTHIPGRGLFQAAIFRTELHNQLPHPTLAAD